MRYALARRSARMDSLRRQPFPVRLMTPVVLTGWLASGGISLGADPQHHTEALAAQVTQQTQRAEKQEGTHDLVPDRVTTKPNAAGEEVIEQVGEASFYGKRFQGKKT